MTTENFCSYEVSKLLKEKGFDEPCRTYYENKKFVDDVCTQYNQWNSKSSFGQISAPTHQAAMKWLREVHNIVIIIEPHAYDYANEKNKSYDCSLWVGDNYYEYLGSKDYPTYEEATETAIKYCLENLI